MRVVVLPAVFLLAGFVGWLQEARAQSDTNQVVALWLFDEPRGLYPSAVLNDASDSDYPLVLGLGGEIVTGMFGNALEVRAEPATIEPLTVSDFGRRPGEGDVRFGLVQLPVPPGRTVEPMSWMNAHFTALMTSGENHLRKEVGFVNPSDTRLNLGAFDWTIEFWYRPTRDQATEGVVFEIGEGPRGENERLTRLVLNGDGSGFRLFNRPSGTSLVIPSDSTALDSTTGRWHHLAFVYAAEEAQLRHYVDGQLQPLPEQARFEPLSHGEEAYFTIGRDGRWVRPLPGQIDELRFAAERIYADEFEPPESFAIARRVAVQLPHEAGLPLLFGTGAEPHNPVPLGGRKHLFIDAALVGRMERVTFTVNPPRKAEIVITEIEGPFRKHLSVIEDSDGLIRIYNGVVDDYLAVHTSRDGIHFEAPDLGREYQGYRNIAIPEPTAVGSVFIDPNAPPEDRWKYVSGYHDRAVYVYSSPDGWLFERAPTSVLPMKAGSQSNVFWDAQRESYVGYHRSDCRAFPSGETKREFVMTETEDLIDPWPFEPVARAEIGQAADTMLLRDPQPWFMDNGPLSPGGFCLEYPTIFGPVDSLDPLGTDIYVPKAVKYRWAPDTYLAFPSVYFHYWEAGPRARQTLGQLERGLGSGPIETQLSVSRDGTHWKRYPRPAYVGIGRHADMNVVQAYMAHGMVRRGNEIWQYYYGTEEYHSAFQEDMPRGVFRVVQRLDGFVSADTPYDTTGILVTKPLSFEGNRLVLNIDTDAAGYAQVGFQGEGGNPIEGFSVDDCVYINGDFIEKEVEWLGKGFDVSELEGRTVRLVFRMRGSKLYAMQFVRR
ncbi:MAG: LamG domain-containing protein [Gemmatimonadota bacterium]